MTTLAPGHRLGERFKLVRLLGKGGMGEAWLVEDLELSDRVVAKVLPPDATEDQLTLLRRECRNARKLVHTNIVPVYELHRVPGFWLITMAHVDGTEIASLRGQPIEEVLPALIAVAEALAYAHERGVTHRDLKPSNVLVDETGTPRVLDFGIAGLVWQPDADVELRGGGSEGSASPQQLAGEPATIADDIYAFGSLARDLLSGRRLPVKLDTLLNACLNRDPEHRPSSMSDVKAALESVGVDLAASRDEPAPSGRRVKLTPPPRLDRVEAISPPSGSTALRERRSEPGGIGAKTMAAFGLAIVLAGVVFIALPRWVEQSRRSVPPREAAPPEAQAADDAVETPALEDLAQEMARAERARERAGALRDALDDRDAGLWGGDSYRAALAAMTRGDELMGRRDFAEAEEQFREAVSGFESVQADASRIARDAIAQGRTALATGSASEAEDAFTLAATIEPGSTEAEQGLRRAAVLDDLRQVVARGEEQEARGDLEGAAESYRRAIALDPLSEAAQRGLARIDSKASEIAFTDAMSEAVAALNRSDFAAARVAFERARAIKPAAPDVADGLKAVEEGERLQKIAEHRERAAELERQEAWRAAEREYQSVLAIDDTIRFAREGKARATTRAALSEKLEFHITHPERLSDADVLEEASSLLEDAKAVAGAGPKLEQQVVRLADLVSEYSTPVQVRLLSDGKTEVVVYRIGTLGKFDSHALVLRPGTYTVVGRREGFRDVRHRLVVSAEAPPEPLMVRCEEEI